MKKLSHYLYHGFAMVVGGYVIFDGYLRFTSTVITDKAMPGSVALSAGEALLGLTVIGVALKRIFETPEGDK